MAEKGQLRQRQKNLSPFFSLVYQVFAWGVISTVFHNSKKKGEGTNADQQGC
jgi:hypothetical protein